MKMIYVFEQIVNGFVVHLINYFNTEGFHNLLLELISTPTVSPFNAVI